MARWSAGAHAPHAPVLAALLVAGAVACSSESTGPDLDPETTTSGGGGAGGTLFDIETGAGGGPIESCAAGAEWIYLRSSDDRVVRFEPDTLTFETLGTLACGVPGLTPFSMGVDRDARAYMLYASVTGSGPGRIVKVDLPSLACGASFVPSPFEYFGMGFVRLTDASGEATERLYVSGGVWADGIGSGSTLGDLDVATGAVRAIGPLPGYYAAELTGTADGQLWGYFAQPDLVVRQLDPRTGAVLREIPVPPEASSSAYAFAHWGGKFYVFGGRRVVEVDPTTSSATTVVPDAGFEVVGAGVSTCAPVAPPA